MHNGEPAEVPHYKAKHSRDLSKRAWTHTHLDKRTSTKATHTHSNTRLYPCLETK